MQARVCEWCGAGFNSRQSVQKYCSPSCGYAAKRKVRAPWPPAEDRTCEVCRGAYRTKAANQKYCSPSCREKAKYQILRADADQWEIVKAKKRAQYIPKPKHETRLCSVPTCDRKHCARGFCAKHYYGARRASGETDGKGRTAPPPDLLRALVKRYDESGEFIEEPWVTSVPVRIEAALVRVTCPCCKRGPIYAVRPDSREFWDCSECRARVRLNQEEVEWLLSEKRSTPQSSQAAI